MQIKDMFRKKIDREIQGVIIVGQGEETNVAQELEEYVVTRELQRHFADFFAAYKKGIQGTTPKMGVWISGFFGSGKSHFLKILSYLLQNKQVGDKHAIDYFIEDQKITNQMVLADMQLAANTPSDRHSDYERLYGFRLLCPRQRGKGSIGIYGLCRKYQSERGCVAQDFLSV